MALSIFLLLIGLGLLVKGANFLVDGGSSLAKKFKISPLVIGLTIVAFGTSAPELIVNLVASFKGNTDIAIGNVIGSNIANIFFILGICAMIYPLTVSKGTAWKEIPLSLLAALVMGVLANDMLIDKAGASALSRIDGIVMLSFFIIFLVYTFGISKVSGNKEDNVKEFGLSKTIIFIVVGLLALVVGGELIVSNATSIARHFGISEFLIGITIVAVGTSLPELATSAVAAYKKNSDIAIGNIVGSNIFNVFFILGISASIKPLPFSPLQNLDILMAIAASLILFLWLFIGKKHTLERWQGAIFVLIYIAYIVFAIYRG